MLNKQVVKARILDATINVENCKFHASYKPIHFYDGRKCVGVTGSPEVCRKVVEETINLTAIEMVAKVIHIKKKDSSFNTALVDIEDQFKLELSAILNYREVTLFGNTSIIYWGELGPFTVGQNA